MNGPVFPEQVGEVTTSQVLTLKRTQTCFEPTFRVVDDPLITTVVKDIALRGVPTTQRVGRRIDSTPGKQCRKTLAIKTSGSAPRMPSRIASRCRCPGSNPGRGRKYSKAPGTSTTAQRHEAGGRGMVKVRTSSVLAAKFRLFLLCE